MTQDEIDTMWQKAMQESIKDGEMFTRYRFAKLVAERALADSMHEVQRLGQEIEQEPVEWAKFLHYPECWDTAAYPILHDAIHEALAWSGCSVCTPPAAQPPQRTWVGLTDDDDIDWEEGGNLRDLVKAIEAKLKEKNT